MKLRTALETFVYVSFPRVACGVIVMLVVAGVALAIAMWYSFD